jgi:ribosomal protein S18 acetylase RimI-like enzyme
VAADPAGSIPLILVDPGCQRRGIGTSLLDAALGQARAAGASRVTAGSGGASHIWPGVPRDLPAATSVFTARGWQHTHGTLDLVADLASYRPPPGAFERAATTGVIITRAAGTDLEPVHAFEAATFPSWTRWFAAQPEHILLARDRSGSIAGTLLLEGPGAASVFAPLLGLAAATIGCVGVAPPRQNQGIGTALAVRASQILAQAGTRNGYGGYRVRGDYDLPEDLERGYQQLEAVLPQLRRAGIARAPFDAERVAFGAAMARLALSSPGTAQADVR